MDELQRRRYLAAMGIPLWLPRNAPEPEARAEPGGAVPEAQPRTAQSRATEYRPVAAPAPPALALDEAPRVEGLGWDELASRVADCLGCPELVANRTRTVFGVGDHAASLMVVGEAPGMDEDRQGEPFVGRAGQLLNRMLQAVGFSRGEVFIANILKCRPPNNRDPHQEEALRCEPFLARQIELVAPRAILSVGRISAHHLLKTETPVGRLRGRLHYLRERRIPVVVTYHPAYLLRSPQQKGKAWEDLQLLLRTLRRDAP